MNWKLIIKEEMEKDYFKKIISFIQDDSKNHIIYPDQKDIFNAFKYSPLDKTRVVILGMDPYINKDQAHGLAFSVNENCTIPPSLKNIFKEIKSDLDTDHNFSDGCLVPWAQQGVLLLNTILTVRDGESNSHRNFGWQTFTDKIISVLNNLDKPIVFILWGNHAKGKRNLISNSRHLILDGSHPSPLSAYNGFFGNKYFSKANNFLIQNNLEPINWLI